MKKRTLVWQLYSVYLLVLCISLFSVTLFSLIETHNYHIQNTQEKLIIGARFVEKFISDALVNNDLLKVQTLCIELGKISSTRITVILPDGKVIGDSEHDPSTMDNHSDRPEIKKAMNGNIGSSVRYSFTLSRTFMYIAIPVRRNNTIAGVIRTSFPLTAISTSFKALVTRIILAGIIIALFATIPVWFMSRRITGSLDEIKQAAQRFASGDLNFRLPVSMTDEISALSTALNQMASQLSDRIHTIEAQKNKEEVILSSMAEGVFAVDMEERIISINQSAARLLGVNQNDLQGKIIEESIGNPHLQETVKKILKMENVVEELIILVDKVERYLQIHGTILKDANGKKVGAVVVLRDITQLRRLEDLRREFVANVSHELKTPITSLKGFVETLLDGAMADPNDAKRFLGIIANQTDRLNAIIEDLLTLAHIEKEDERREIQLETASLKETILSAVNMCTSKATEKNITLDFKQSDDITATFNTHLIEQAIVNLIDNAIKYSNPESTVHILLDQQDNNVVISVRDHGCGISKEHISRIFERFYRVDKARSRKLGGTGLGLAIVKHIVQVHGGKVTVESIVGQGSIFTIVLPQK